MGPEAEAHTDTAVQKDLLDVYKHWFKLPPKPKNPHPENKVFFTLNPLANAPTSSGNAFVTSTTANMYLGPKKQRIYLRPTLLHILISINVLDFLFDRQSG